MIRHYQVHAEGVGRINIDLKYGRDGWYQEVFLNGMLVDDDEERVRLLWIAEDEAHRSSANHQS